jgi:hypothetical protein
MIHTFMALIANGFVFPRKCRHFNEKIIAFFPTCRQEKKLAEFPQFLKSASLDNNIVCNQANCNDVAIAKEIP